MAANTASSSKKVSINRRSLMLTGGCVAAGAFIGLLPRISAVGFLGDDAAATVSPKKRLAKWERDMRVNLDTDYLNINSFETVLSNENSGEESLRLVGTISLTPMGLKDLPAAAQALADVGEYGRPLRITIVQDEKTPVIEVYRFATLTKEDWLGTLNSARAFADYSVDALETTKTGEAVVVTARLTSGTWSTVLARYRQLRQVVLPEAVKGRYRVNLKNVNVPSQAVTEVRIDHVGKQQIMGIADALEAAATSTPFVTLTGMQFIWLGADADPKERMMRLDFSDEEDTDKLSNECARYFDRWTPQLPEGLETYAYRRGEKLSI